ncbi:hypothetical protein LIER_35477 [Lithospermum erythrorhizon]|uniref:Transposase-associated domain-containing protein n=1 Tax=Lithospermum erythrorhizon TaxID=34254 RepID=A0AAV3NRG7_LITER
MYRRLDKSGYITNELIGGVQEFVDFSLSQPGFFSHEKIKCQCSKCKNLHYQKVECVCGHLCQSGLTNGYFTWNHHSEECHSRVSGATNDVPQMDNTNSYRDMIINAMGPTRFEELKEVRGESESMDLEASRFYNLLCDADEPL